MKRIGFSNLLYFSSYLTYVINFSVFGICLSYLQLYP